MLGMGLELLLRGRCMNKNKPPKTREFLGLVSLDNTPYWDIFWWATKEDGVGGKSCFVDRGFFDMPELLGWVELPDIEEIL